MTYEAFKKKHKRGPRITSMSSAFNGFVDGTKGKPIINYKSSKDLLKGDVYNLSFYICSQRYATPFTLHASASVPLVQRGITDWEQVFYVMQSYYIEMKIPYLTFKRLPELMEVFPGH